MVGGTKPRDSAGDGGRERSGGIGREVPDGTRGFRVTDSGIREDGTILVYDRNEFNEISCLTMLWTVQNFWTAGARFVFN